MSQGAIYKEEQSTWNKVLSLKRTISAFPENAYTSALCTRGDITLSHERVPPPKGEPTGQTVGDTEASRQNFYTEAHISSRCSKQKSVPEVQPSGTQRAQETGIFLLDLVQVATRSCRLDRKSQAEIKSTGSKTTLSCPVYIHVI